MWGIFYEYLGWSIIYKRKTLKIAEVTIKRRLVKTNNNGSYYAVIKNDTYLILLK